VLKLGSSDVQSFTMDKVQDAETLALAQRVTVREDPAMTAQLPDKRPARVTIQLKDGRTLSAETQSNRGDWADPYPPGEIHYKYQSLTARLWSADQAEAVWDAIETLPDAPDTSALFTRISG
jgi:2-methylcitrate dehydratase PrpD